MDPMAKKPGKSGLMLLLGGGKKDDASEPAEEEASGEDSLIDDFVSAVKDGDAEGARAAFKAAVRACSSAEEAGEYDADDEEE